MHANRLEYEDDPLHAAPGACCAPGNTAHPPEGVCTPLALVEERKRIEMAEGDSLYSQKMEAIGTLAGGIAHDFNNLLMVIQGNISLLRHRLDGGSQHQALLEKIEQATRTGSQLTRKLLAYARKGKYHIEQVDLNELARESLNILGRARKDVTVRADLATPLWKVSVDRCQMEQVLLNLIVNAFDAMPASGQLRVRTGNVPEQEAQRLTGQPAQGDYVLVEVADTGVGMDPQTLSRIFDPYFSTKKATRGAGLGLASVLGIVKNHGGHICVTSTKGAGSMFTVLLPAMRQAVCAAVRPDCTRAQATILVVDDEQIVLETVTKMLERLGYGVIPAANGTEALALFRQNRDRIDLVLLDLVMPGVSAGDILGEIKASRPEVKIVLSSGYSLANLQERNQTQGSDGFIAKPYTMGELSKAVQATLAKNPQEAFPQ